MVETQVLESDAEPLEIVSEVSEDEATVQLTGELDIAAVETLEWEFEQVRLKGAKKLLVDLGPLRFIDSSGLHALLRLNRRCASDGCVLSIAPGPEQVSRVLAITGLDRVLPMASARP